MKIRCLLCILALLLASCKSEGKKEATPVAALEPAAEVAPIETIPVTAFPPPLNQVRGAGGRIGVIRQSMR